VTPRVWPSIDCVRCSSRNVPGSEKGMAVRPFRDSGNLLVERITGRS